MESIKKDLVGVDGKKEQLLTFGKYRILEGTNILGSKVYRVGCYQTPACFMQILADVAATQLMHKISDKYVKALGAFGGTFVSGMEHPHWTETYYLISKGAFNNAW